MKRSCRELPRLKKELSAGIVVANGENSAEGNGITPYSAQHLFASGVDVLTTGNHALRRRDVYDLLEEGNGIVRPANFHPSAPGKGWFLHDNPAFPLAVVNLQGRVYMDPPLASPFDTADALLSQIDCPNILVDFHAEATAEMLALGHYLDGRVSAVIGTHTHVQTADERLLPRGDRLHHRRGDVRRGGTRSLGWRRNGRSNGCAPGCRCASRTTRNRSNCAACCSCSGRRPGRSSGSNGSGSPDEEWKTG